MNRPDEQILRSRAFRALAQDDKPGRASEEGGRRTDGFTCFFVREASEPVILSAEGAKDLLRGMANA